MQKRFFWKLKDRELSLGDRTLVMGILNVTPDSFSDGGLYDNPEKAVSHALELESAGADILDVGAESTRPGSQRISEAEELRRLVPVLKRLRGQLSIPISVDTYKAAVAEKAIEYGAEIINDPTGLLLDLQLARVVGEARAGLVLNHMRGLPDTWARLGPIKNLMRSLAIDFEAACNRARQGGVEKTQVVLDPGLGFGKRKEQNAEIIARLRQLQSLDLPLMVGPSRKSFLDKNNVHDNDFATAGAVAVAILNGAHIVRVHNVGAIRAAVDVIDVIRNSEAQEEEDLEKKPVAPPRPRVQPILGEGRAPAIRRPGSRPPFKRVDTRGSSVFRADREPRGE